MLTLGLLVVALLIGFTLLTAAITVLDQRQRGWVRESSRRMERAASDHQMLRTAYESHQKDTKKNMKTFRREMDKAQGAIVQQQVFTAALEAALQVLHDRAITAGLDKAASSDTEYLYRVNLGVLVGVTAPPGDPEIRTILWENCLDMIRTAGESDTSLIDSFGLVEARLL